MSAARMTSLKKLFEAIPSLLQVHLVEQKSPVALSTKFWRVGTDSWGLLVIQLIFESSKLSSRHLHECTSALHGPFSVSKNPL